MTITQLIMKLAPWNYVHSIENKILVKIKPKRDTRLQKKIEQISIFLATMVKIPLRVHGHQWMFTTGIQIFLR